jgi:uncharacterized protein YhaN
MRLERFELRGFAQHDELDLTFSDGEPNLIIGPNEAGKSHLMTALTGTIFGIEKPEVYIPWHSEPAMTGCLVFQAGEDRVEIKRRFLEQQVEVYVNGEPVYSGRGLVRRSTAEDQRYRSLLHRWIGFTELDVFERTVFVGQDQVHDSDLGSFTSQFKRLISGTREANYETAIQDLEANLDRLVKLPGKRSNRRREDLLDRLADLRERHRKADEVQSQVVKLIKEERALQEKVNETRQTYERYSGLAESYAEIQRATAQETQSRLAWNDLQEQVERLRRAREQRLKQEAKRDELHVPGNPDPDEILEISREIERLEPRIEYLVDALERNREVTKNREFLESELERFRYPGKVEATEVLEMARQFHQAEQTVAERQKQLDETMKEYAPPPRTSDGLRHTLFTVAALILIGSLTLGWFLDPLFFAGVLIALAVLIAGFIADRGTDHQIAQNERYAIRTQELRQELQEAIDELKEVQACRSKLLAQSKVETLHDLFYRAREFKGTQDRLNALPELEDFSEDELSEAQVKLRQCTTRREELLRTTGHSDLDTLYKQAREYREVLRILEQMEAVEPEQIENLVDRMTSVQQEAVIARHTRQRLLWKYPELEDVKTEEISEFRQKAEQGERELQDLERRLYEIQLDRKHLGKEAEDAGELQLHINELREQLKQVERSAEAHKLAIETLKESALEFQENALIPVAERAGSHMQSITDGRYQRVELDRDSMTPLVSGNGQTGISLDRLSRGTRDQLYFSIRAALIDALSGDRKLPMLLDDPCVNFDEERLSNAANLLKDLACERSILLFTKDETWTRWFDPVLRLERRESLVEVEEERI